MNQNELLNQLESIKLVPVVKLDRIEDTLPLCEALCQGGLPVAEITFRTAAAEEAIRQACKAFPDMLIGAGTIVNVKQAQKAADAGAKFLVSPGFSKEVTEFALNHDLLILPGACTPTELMFAMEYELPVVKFFPASQYGGLNAIKALAAPFPSVRFMPTGGISPSNIEEFLSFDKIIACGGSWMVKDHLIKEGNFSEIQRLTAEAVQMIHQAH